MSGLVYLASPIDQDHSRVSAGLRERARAVLGHAGLGVYDPAAAWCVAGVPEPAIEQANRAAQEACGATLALLPEGVASIGVPIEIERAVRVGQRVAILGSTGSYSLAGYRGCPNVLHLTLSPDDLGPAVEWLQAGLAGAPESPGEAPPCPGEALGTEPGATAPPGALETRWAGSGPPPTQHHPGDAGWDLSYAGREPIVIRPGDYVEVDCGLAMQLPEGYWGMLVGRSSTFRTRGLLVNTSVIDQGYRGELFAMVRNISLHQVSIEPGERVAQLVLLPLVDAGMHQVEPEFIEPSQRGTQGFGSTGL